MDRRKFISVASCAASAIAFHNVINAASNLEGSLNDADIRLIEKASSIKRIEGYTEIKYGAKFSFDLLPISGTGEAELAFNHDYASGLLKLMHNESEKLRIFMQKAVVDGHDFFYETIDEVSNVYKKIGGRFSLMEKDGEVKEYDGKKVTFHQDDLLTTIENFFIRPSGKFSIFYDGRPFNIEAKITRPEMKGYDLIKVSVDLSRYDISINKLETNMVKNDNLGMYIPYNFEIEGSKTFIFKFYFTAKGEIR